MNSVEFWLSLVELAREMRRLRDMSNPLELEKQIFVKNFRLSKAAFIYFLRLLESKLKAGVRSTFIPAIVKLSTKLRFCAQGSYQVSVGNESNIGFGQSTVSLVLTEVFQVFEEHICKEWISFNYNKEQNREAKIYFFERSGIPSVIGCIDGTHGKIVAPRKDLQHLYYNRKGYFSINAMMVCDNMMRIRYVNARYPGATHDSLVFNKPALKSKLEDDYRGGDRNTLLGDAGYALQPESRSWDSKKRI